MKDENFIRPGGYDLGLWGKSIGKSPSTLTRWGKRGWIKTENIAGKKFILQSEIDRFWARAAAGEFRFAPRGSAAKKQQAARN